jgi:hypothetical protein
MLIICHRPDGRAAGHLCIDLDTMHCMVISSGLTGLCLLVGQAKFKQDNGRMNYTIALLE